jgi:hypothetical protein
MKQDLSTVAGIGSHKNLKLGPLPRRQRKMLAARRGGKKGNEGCTKACTGLDHPPYLLYSFGRLMKGWVSITPDPPSPFPWRGMLDLDGGRNRA